MDDHRFPGPDPARAGLCCDYDGTLAPIVAVPGQARMPESLRPVLADLAERLGLVAVVSGRPAAFLGERVRIPGVRLLGLYGIEEWTGEGVRVRPEVVEWAHAVDAARVALRDRIHHEGVTLEDKGITVAVHWRNAPDRAAAEREVLPLARGTAAETGLAIEPGKFVAELRPPVDWDKGTTVRALCEEYHLRTVAYIGDDLGDLVAFKAVQELGGVAVAVESGEETPQRLVEAADYSLDGPAAVAAWLIELRDAVRRS